MSALLLALPSLARIPGPWGMSACLACIGVCQAALVPAQGQLKSNWLPDGPERVFAQVRKTPSWPRSWANFSLL